MENLIFWVFAAVSVLAAIGVVFHRSIVYSALFLLAVFSSIPAFFLLNNADFLAIAQMVVYAVGMTIVMLFGIMFTREKFMEEEPGRRQRFYAFVLIAGFSLALLLAAGAFYTQYQVVTPGSAFIATIQQDGSTGLLGALIFQKYLLPFEIASVLLLVAMVGAIIIAKKSFTEESAGLKYPVSEKEYINETAEGMLKEYYEMGRPGSKIPGVDKAADEPEKTDNEMAGVQ
ncbi:MAG: NADH-quinone oxidoreductase subunit J [Vampirovibrio sp.]|nr:NADH-quinone oxidoreductase subunit J [Vampirovibrio sp.]